MTAEAVESMRGQRGELSDQLQSVAGRRADLAEELVTATPAERPQLEARLKQLDDRILSIESEIARTGALLARAPGQYLQDDVPNLPPFNNFATANATAIGVLFTIFVLAPIAFSFARLVWRRGSNPPRPVADPEQFTQDLYGIMLACHHHSRLLGDAAAESRARRAFDALLAGVRS